MIFFWRKFLLSHFYTDFIHLFSVYFLTPIESQKCFIWSNGTKQENKETPESGLYHHSKGLTWYKLIIIIVVVEGLKHPWFSERMKRIKTSYDKKAKIKMPMPG